MQYKPHPYQRYATQMICDKPAAGLFLDMGLGKTVATLTAIQQLLYDDFVVSKVLVIAPKRVARDTWPAEMDKWSHLDLTHALVLGDAQKRRQALQTRADVYIINRENVQWLVGYYGKRWPFDMVVLDELSSFKNNQAKRFKALRKVLPKVKRVVGLTGTPAPNGLVDLWPQMYLLDRGERLGKTITSFRDRWFYPGARRGHTVFEWLPKTHAEEEIYQSLSDICISMQAVDWLDMPQITFRDVGVEMPPKARERYKTLERDLLLGCTDSDVVADSAAVLSNKLLQMSNGAVYDEHGDVQHIHDVKLDKLEDAVESANGRPLLVYYTYRHDLERIQERFPDAVAFDSSEHIRDWNAGKIQMLMAHPASAGHGLNLQDGGHHIIWFGLPWSLELYQQANARLHRQGQRRTVYVYHIVCKDTMDQAVLRALENKDTSQAALVEALRARAEEVNRCT